MDNTDVIIIGNDFTKTGVAETKDYVVHALCTRGACSFVYNDRKYDFRKDNLLIIREHQLMRYIMPRHDFEVMVLYIHLPFIENITPDINFGIRSTLLLLENPILRLTKKRSRLQFGRYECHCRTSGRQASCFPFTSDRLQLPTVLFGYIQFRTSHLWAISCLPAFIATHQGFH